MKSQKTLLPHLEFACQSFVDQSLKPIWASWSLVRWKFPHVWIIIWHVDLIEIRTIPTESRGNTRWKKTSHLSDFRWRKTLLTCSLTAPAFTAFLLFRTISTGWLNHVMIVVNYRATVSWLFWKRGDQIFTNRAITAQTMAEVLEGRYNHKIRSVRVIDCRW